MKLELEQCARARTPHVLVLPCPAQGHLNPALQFSKLLTSKGLNVTVIIVTATELSCGQLGSVQVKQLSYSDSTENCEAEEDEERDGYGNCDLLKQYRKTLKMKLPGVVSQVEAGGDRVVCLVYDSLLWWCLGVARKLNLVAAAFFTQSCSVDAIYCGVREGRVRVPVALDERNEVFVEGLGRMLELHDLPSFFFEPEDPPGSFDLLSAQFTNVGLADWVFCNTFTTLEAEVLEYMGSRFKFKPVGPTIPSTYLGKQLTGDTAHDYGLSYFKPKPEANNYVAEWLDSKEQGSVVYVSFGSLVAVSGEQIAEVAAALKATGYPFLWVVRESEESKLPRDFLRETSQNGVVVRWCSQLEVLAHRSTGCFLTHCGWNSTMEAMSLGVPMVGVPWVSDQTTNAKFIADVWKVGVRVVKKTEKSVVEREEIGAAVIEVMEGEMGKRIRRNAEKWKGIARAAAAKGGSSDKNIEEFVAELEVYNSQQRL
ncbi:unnamed protein product [Linum tenue]|uniref:Glycosyltransferase n=1 Tax=Linum tenue TaxID=586396 RepID=A0AAV0KLD9_9ROSI|nr:unnamed protein product [Linum tenue]